VAYSESEVSAEVHALINEVRHELELPSEKRESGASTHDLLWVVDVLTRAAEEAEGGGRIVVTPGLGRLVVDGWSLMSQLSARLVDFAQRHEPR
jgi:hypothetical protein